MRGRGRPEFIRQNMFYVYNMDNTHINELLGGEVEELVELDSAVGECAEGTLLLELGRKRRVRNG